MFTLGVSIHAFSYEELSVKCSENYYIYLPVCMQALLRNAGGHSKPTVFLITDSQIKEDSFLEDIDSLLNSSEVPNLFTPDERVELLEVENGFLN